MSTRAPGAAASRPAAAVDTPGWNDLPRQQMAAAAQACCAVFRGFEAIRRMQQMAAHQALAHHQAVAERLKEPCQPMDLVAIQAEMVQFDMQGATLYWQQLAGAMAAMQRELLGSAVMPQAEHLTGAHGRTAVPGANPFLFDIKGGTRAATQP